MNLFAFILIAILPLGMAAQRVQEFPEFVAKADEISVSQLLGTVEAPVREDPRFILAQNFLKNAKLSTFVFDDLCSATFVSGQGHALMALHCLERLSTPLSNAAIPNKAFKGVVPDLVGQEVNLNWQDLSQFGLIPDSDGVKVKVVATGKGYPNYAHEGLKTTIPTKWRDFNDDYALVKFEALPAGHVCAKVSDQLPQSGEIVWVTGFPKYVKKTTQTLHWLVERPLIWRTGGIKNKHDREQLDEYLTEAGLFYKELRFDRADPDPHLLRESARSRNELYVSVGRLFKNAEELGKRHPWPLTELNLRLDPLYPHPKYFSSTAHGASQMSGGGAYSSQGELIGVNSAIFSGPTIYSQFKLGVRHISTPHILQEITAKYGPAISQRIFDCD